MRNQNNHSFSIKKLFRFWFQMTKLGTFIFILESKKQYQEKNNHLILCYFCVLQILQDIAYYFYETETIFLH